MMILHSISISCFTKKLVWAVTIGSFLTILVIIILAVNIHRRNKAELALRKSDAKYHSLVDNLRVGVYRSSAEQNGKILRANPSMVVV